MRRVLACAVLGVLVAAPLARADELVEPAGGFGGKRAAPPPPCCPVAPLYPGMGTPGTVPNPTDPMNPNPNPNPNAMVDPLANPFAQPTEAGGLAYGSFNPNFDGDFIGVFYTRTITTGFTTATRVVGFTQQVVGSTQQVTIDAQGNRVTTSVPVTVNVPVTQTVRVPVTRTVRLPAAGRYNGIQIVDNDQARPMDRVYFGYNAYNRVGAALNPGLGGSDLQRQIAGFEKTFLDGDASVGLRLPFVQQYGPVGAASSTVGDLTVLFKYAFYNNKQTGDVASVGLAITAPTGGDGDGRLIDGSGLPHSWLFQPWAGFVKVFDRAYVQGISNLIVPTDGRDPTLLGNSVAVGYWVYRNPNDRVLTGIIPTIEVHVRTPLNRRTPSELIFAQDQVNVTSGLHFRFTRAAVTGAVSVPLVGPRPWAIEAMGYVNYNF